MGINNLLLHLRSIISKVHLRKYKGKRIGIDGSCWLYKGSYFTSIETNNDLETKKYLLYFQQCLQLLLNEEIIPIVIFDGRFLPIKEITNKKRKEKKEKYKNLGQIAELEGRKEDAKLLYQRSFSSTFFLLFFLSKL